MLSFLYKYYIAFNSPDRASQPNTPIHSSTSKPYNMFHSMNHFFVEALAAHKLVAVEPRNLVADNTFAVPVDERMA